MASSKYWLTAVIGGLLMSLGCWGPYARAASSADTLQPRFTIQIGSFRNHSDADQELQRIKAFAPHAFVRHEAVQDKGMWYRVYVGLFPSKAAATSYANNLVKDRRIAGYWVKTIAPPFPDFIEPPAAATPTRPETAPAAPLPPVRAETPAPGLPQPALRPEPETQKSPPPVPENNRRDTSPKPRFRIGLKGGAILASGTEDIGISDSGGGGDQRYSFSGTYTPAGVTLSFWPEERFFVRGSLDKALGAHLDLYQITLDAGMVFIQDDTLTTYATAGVIFGQMDWDDFPGDFDNAMGWKIGVGTSYPMGKIQLGIEGSYQAMNFDYTLPPTASTTSGPDAVDLSGFAITAFLTYGF